MSQIFHDISTTTDIKELKRKIRENFGALKSDFSGTGFPLSPATGQIAVVNDIQYIYTGDTWKAISLTDHDHDDLYYIESEVDTLMSAKLAVGAVAYNATYYNQSETLFPRCNVTDGIYITGGYGTYYFRGSSVTQYGMAGVAYGAYGNYTDYYNYEDWGG